MTFCKNLNSFKISNFWGAMSRSSFRDGLRSRTLRKIVPRNLPRPIKILHLRFVLPKSWEEGELSRLSSHIGNKKLL